ncbi:MAG: DUF3604 domain-containing protein [Halioglobus sp.]
MKSSFLFFAAAVGLHCSLPVFAEPGQPCADYNALGQPFFGDLHVHTRYSLDANTQGTRTSPDEAYRFARGERIGVQPWSDDGKAQRSLQLSKPLDFAMVSDHAELIGEVRMCNEKGVEGYGAWQCRLYRAWPLAAYYLFNATASLKGKHLSLCGENDALCLAAAVAPWQEMQRAAATHNDDSGDCAFTTFIGYEWTGLEGISGGNLHRNVVFRSDDVPPLPISFIDEPEPEGLWRGLDSHCESADGDECDSLVIPHNSNISAGFMFPTVMPDGSAFSSDYNRMRSRHEPLVEIMQHKGASECFYQRGATKDELCAFEQMPINNIAGRDNKPTPDTGFVRETLIDGLKLGQTSGVNPYQFGFIGSTDTHLGAPGAAEEDRFLGHGGAGASARDEVQPGFPDKLEYNPGGLAVLWAPQNTRASLFDAMRRREAYATSGPRIITRLFAGWDFSPALCESPDRVSQGYARGVPMGADMLPNPNTLSEKSGAPTLLVSAGQDVGTRGSPGQPLQRIQIIKGWVDNSGQKHERVFDVAGDPNNGASVDVNSCETRGKGFAQLCSVWVDPDFDAKQSAFYYARAVENPSCRWSQRQCVAAGVDCGDPDTVPEPFEQCCSDEHRPVIQERAWTSPIWYQPESTTLN